MLCSVTHGAPLPSCASVTFWRASGHASLSANVLMPSSGFHACANVLPASAAVVVPVTGVDSKRDENLPSATTPHALATVVFQRPCCMRPSAPRTRRGMSSFHAATSLNATRSLLALLSAEIMSHHSASRLSVLKFIVVPWKLRRERSTCSAAVIRSSRRGSFGWRLRIRYQSITADVGHRFGSMVKLSSHFALSGSARRDSASRAATLRMARSAVGNAE